MPLENDISAILDSGHATVRCSTHGVEYGSSRVTVDPVRRIDNLCWDAAATINRTANTIEFKAVAEGAQTADSVIVGNESLWAATGEARPPKYKFIYSDQFSGCIFFLFRDASGAVFGSHSYRASGQFADPTPYFWRKGAKLLYCFSTAGLFSRHGPDVFGSVLCHITPTAININFFALRGDKVIEVVDRQQINDWKTYQIDRPALTGALGKYDPTAVARNYTGVTQAVQTPAKNGLKQKVKKFYLKYIK